MAYQYFIFFCLHRFICLFWGLPTNHTGFPKIVEFQGTNNRFGSAQFPSVQGQLAGNERATGQKPLSVGTAPARAGLALAVTTPQLTRGQATAWIAPHRAEGKNSVASLQFLVLRPQSA